MSQPAARAHVLDRLIGDALPELATLDEVAAFEAQAPWADRVAAASTYEALRLGAALNPDAPALVFLPEASADDTPVTLSHAQFI
ncbi:MAG: hypothetical protein CFE32_25095, partial [Alphaproteobacteria bacterium PA3]